MTRQPTRFGVDTGGTFTDVICRIPSGELAVHKLLSTPADPSKAIGDGVGALKSDGEGRREVIHGTTVATNALLERRGAKIAFVTTKGFEDLLWLRRQTRPELYALQVEVEPPLVEQSMSFGVAERLDERGGVVEELTDRAIAQIVDEVDAVEPEAVVVCLLHAYANEAHEQRLVDAFRRHREDWHVTGACEITATFREYERASTATINGYVGPVMGRYLAKLQRRLTELDRLEVLQSHGGRADVEQAGRLPVQTVLSGPAGGVVGAVEAAKEVGVEQVISFDMGGTSTDVSLANGEPTLTEEGAIGSLPLQVPVIDIYTVGAGGGSIAWIDAGGALRVGPRSAGADPGPAAYGNGGNLPTVTDAHVVLGSLRPDRFLGGGMELDVEAAQRVVGELAEELGEDMASTARGILEVADAAMARAIKVISLERGHDPRNYSLVAFGGAGGLHACRLAKVLEMDRVMVPRFPGLLSAVGMLRADAKRLYSQTALQPLEGALKGAEQENLKSLMAQFENRAKSEMGGGDCSLSWTASLRYEGQSFAIALEVDWAAGVEVWSDPTERFEEEHQRLYGYRAKGRPVELVDLRLEARRSAPGWTAQPVDDDEEGQAAPAQTVEVDLGDGPAPTEIIERTQLAIGDVVDGPAVITEYSGTTLVLAGWSAENQSGHLVLRRRREQ